MNDKLGIEGGWEIDARMRLSGVYENGVVLLETIYLKP